MSEFTPINRAMELESLCARNFQQLSRLLPDWSRLGALNTAYAPDKPDLHVHLIERSPYTLTLCLSHDFLCQPRLNALPDLYIRVYLDAQLAEALSDHHRPEVTRVYKNPGQLQEIRDYKWRLNYFFYRWLEHCLNSRYCFQPQSDKLPA
ncbi:MAG: DUF1249 domain-containing protein [Methylococcales bacterium]|nr:DUF1249 domain-containing protein [Methylococcales bacterium]